MNIQLLRIDDRLIHGQVVIGWVSFLGSEQIVLCDDNIAQNEWEKDLYLSVIPEDLKAQVLSTADLAKLMSSDHMENTKTIIVVGSPAVVEQLLELNCPIREVNLGGIHYEEPRQKYLTYVYLSDTEIASFNRLENRGVRITCQDVPNAKKLSFSDMLEHKH